MVISPRKAFRMEKSLSFCAHMVCDLSRNSNLPPVIKVHCSNSVKLVRNFFLQAMLER